MGRRGSPSPNLPALPPPGQQDAGSCARSEGLTLPLRLGSGVKVRTDSSLPITGRLFPAESALRPEHGSHGQGPLARPLPPTRGSPLHPLSPPNPQPPTPNPHPVAVRPMIGGPMAPWPAGEAAAAARGDKGRASRGLRGVLRSQIVGASAANPERHAWTPARGDAALRLPFCPRTNLLFGNWH